MRRGRLLRSLFYSTNREKVDIRKRAYLAILGILALFVWAGFIVGSVLAAMASVMPSRKKEPVREKI